MKRLMYAIPLSVIAVLVFAAIAVAQDVQKGQQDGQVPSQNTTDTNTTDVQNSTTVPAKKTPAETTTPAKSTAPATDTTVAVDINDLAFAPPQLNIAPGTRVMFVNNGTQAHTATADNELFDTGALEPRESTWVLFRGSGTVTYHDELHPDMKGSIVVGKGGGGEDTTPPKQAAEEAPNEPSSDAAQPTTETTQPAKGN
jgi:plastocyanin